MRGLGFVASSTAPLRTAADLFGCFGPAAAAFAAEDDDGPRSRFGWGEALVVEASGDQRMQDAARRIERVAEELGGELADVELLGGFSFEPSRLRDAPALRFALPALTYLRSRGTARLLAAGRDQEAAERALRAALERLDGATSEVPRASRHGVEVPADDARAFEQRVATALTEIARGRVEKVVLVRKERVRAATPFDPEATFVHLVRRHPAARAFLLRWPGEGAFLGASPELLASVSGRRAESEALAGTRHGGSGGEGWTSKELREHAAVVSAIRQALGELGAVTVWAREERRHGPVSHLRTRLSCELTGSMSVLRVAEALHPTPALGGAPRDAALRLLREVEVDERGLYGGAVGAVDLRGGGELAVAIRCASLDGAEAVLFGGAGIVFGSTPHDEAAETQAKLSVVAASLAGAP